jgi:hypothetical protein
MLQSIFQEERLIEMKKILYGAVLAALAFTLVSCGPRLIGYGLVLWAERETDFQSGQIVEILQESQIQQSYLVRLGKKQVGEIPLQRVRFYEQLDAAEEAARAYSVYVDRFGYSERDGLPMREAADQQARIIYKLRAGQLVKIVEQADEPEEISAYRAYWYRVLTEDGVEGFCYGHFLPTFTSRGDPVAEAAELAARDPLLDKLMAQTWRPVYFREMVTDGRIDLLRFKDEYGFFPDRENKEFRLVTPTYRETFNYQEAENVGFARYRFAGTDLRVHMQSEERIALTYYRGSQLISAVYILFDEPIDEIIEAERERRGELFERFRARGDMLTSSAYGSIRLADEMQFRWQGYGRLEERIFLRPVNGSGSIDFPYFLSQELASRYQGVITFRFTEYGEKEGTSFLYAFEPSGVRLVWLRPDGIVNLEALREPISPLVLYFTFSGQS